MLCKHEDFSTLVNTDMWRAFAIPAFSRQRLIKGRAGRDGKKNQVVRQVCKVPGGRLQIQCPVWQRYGTTEARHGTRYRWMDRQTSR